VDKGADPIEMFSGQFTQEATDLSINGAGIGFIFRRSYKNQVIYQGPLGSNWDHSYNLFIREVGNYLVRSSGELREEIYTRHPNFGQAGFDYWVPPDGQFGIIEKNGITFILRSPSGVHYQYQQDSRSFFTDRASRIATATTSVSVSK
jgi:hypothetical protein